MYACARCKGDDTRTRSVMDYVALLLDRRPYLNSIQCVWYYDTVEPSTTWRHMVVPLVDVKPNSYTRSSPRLCLNCYPGRRQPQLQKHRSPKLFLGRAMNVVAVVPDKHRVCIKVRSFGPQSAKEGAEPAKTKASLRCCWGVGLQKYSARRRAGSLTQARGEKNGV